MRVKGTYRSRTFEQKAAAQRWALDFEQQIGRFPGISVSHSMREALQRYAREVSPKKKGSRWETLRLAKLERDPIADIMLTDLRREDVQAWIARQTISAGSINRELNLIASVLRAARVEWKWMAESIMKDVTRPKQPPPRDRLLCEEEMKRLLLALEYEENITVKTIRQRIAVAMLIALETGMRQGEIWGLDWQNVFLERCFVTLPETKNGTRRDVPLSQKAIDLLEKLLPKKSGNVIGCNQASAATIFRGAVKMAGIKNFTFHDLRHTAITHLARKLDVLDLARMVGHRDIRSLQIYYNATASDIAKRLG